MRWTHTFGLFAVTAMLLLLFGCATDGSFLGIGKKLVEGAADKQADPISLALTPFSLIGGLSIVAGVALLFITKLSRGWIPLGLGIGLCLLAWVVAEWAVMILWLLVPLAALIGLYHLWYIPKGRKLWQENGSSWFSGLSLPSVLSRSRQEG